MGANPKDLFAAVGQLTADALRPFPCSLRYTNHVSPRTIQKMASISRRRNRTNLSPAGPWPGLFMSKPG